MKDRVVLSALARLSLVLTLVSNFALAGFSQTGSVIPRADFERLVVIGDSLSAGYQNNSLLDTQQQFSYPNLIAQQAGTTIPQPLIAYPGIPPVLQLISAGPTPVIAPAPGTSTGRTNPTVQVRNLAVPGARVQDVLTTRPNPADGINTLTDLVLGLPAFVPGVGDNVARSQIEFAEQLQPKIVLLWIGNNDALAAATGASPALLTPIADFESAYTEIVNRVRATGARVVVANIPDVTIIPFLSTAEEVAARVGLPLAFIGPRLGIRSGDYVTPAAFNLIPAILGGATQGPLPGNVVLTSTEARLIRLRVTVFNRFIADQAQRNGFALVDANALLNNADRNGYAVTLANPTETRVLTTNLLGGIFSLDGVHPTRTGYALIADEFIRQLNLNFDAQLNQLDINSIANGDPLVLR